MASCGRWTSWAAVIPLALATACAPLPLGGEDHALVVGLFPGIGSAWYSDTSTTGQPLTWKRRLSDVTLKAALTTFANVVTFGTPTLLGLVAEPFRRWDPCYSADTCANMLFGFVKTKKAIVRTR